MANIFKKIQNGVKDVGKFMTDPLDLGYGDALFGTGDKAKAPDLSGVEANQDEIIKKLLNGQPSEFYEYQPGTMSGTAFDEVQVDPKMREAQLAALRSFTDISSNGGMTLEDQSNLRGFERQNAQADRSRVTDIQNSMAERGMANSGANLALQLASADNAADRSSDASLSTAADARKRALDAISNAGSLSGQMRGQDFSEQSTKASAKDELSRFNTSVLNDAKQYNASGRQGFEQQKFDNNMGTQGLAYNNQTDKANRAVSGYNSDLERQQAEKDRWFNVGAKVAGAAVKGG